MRLSIANDPAVIYVRDTGYVVKTFKTFKGAKTALSRAKNAGRTVFNRWGRPFSTRDLNACTYKHWEFYYAPKGN